MKVESGMSSSSQPRHELAKKVLSIVADNFGTLSQPSQNMSLKIIDGEFTEYRPIGERRTFKRPPTRPAKESLFCSNSVIQFPEKKTKPIQLVVFLLFSEVHIESPSFFFCRAIINFTAISFTLCPTILPTLFFFCKFTLWWIFLKMT